MNRETLIQPSHLRRSALVYVRQSTPKQVALNQESTRRQYQLTEMAQKLGWPRPRISVIDDDLGLSGTSSSERLGFQRLVAAISLGEVGLVLVTEVSRLSRLNSDWHRVIELCAVFATLIADEDGLYDPRDPNDRLVLGLKGTLFSAELHILRARMRGGLLNKARRGALALRLPVGLRRLADGSVVQDPDEQVRLTIQTIFEQFGRLQSARAVQRYFNAHHLQMPRYVQTGPDAGGLVWVAPTYQMIQQVLTNPAYAGLFVFGRRVQQTCPGTPPQIREHRRRVDEWDIVVPGVYPGYISPAQYEANREALRANMDNFAQKGRGAPREGPGLLAGLVVCGKCGRRMTVSYGNHHHLYHCRREQLTYDAPQCQSFAVHHLDAAVRDQFLAAVQPARLETILSALDVLEQERCALDHQWQLKLERARYAARLAQRQYDAVDPENRLVARELETRWNDALTALQALERDYAKACRTELAPLSDAEQQAVRQLAADLPAVWDAPTTQTADRKQLLRLVIQEVRVTVTQSTSPRTAEVTILWSGGATTTHTVRCPPTGWHCVTDPTVVATIRALARELPDYQIAERLNTQGLRTRTGKVWTHARVQSVRKQHQIPTACPVAPTDTPVRGDGLMSSAAAADVLKVSKSLINYWIPQGIIRSEQRMAQSYQWLRLSPEEVARLDGKHDWSVYPTVRQVMRERGCSRDALWEMVRAGRYVPYRHPRGETWEWRLRLGTTSPTADEVANVGNHTIGRHEKGTPQYG
jgi:DNA invertase Pin-like site-specific DNA recombinase